MGQVSGVQPRTVYVVCNTSANKNNGLQAIQFFLNLREIKFCNLIANVALLILLWPIVNAVHGCIDVL